MHARIEVWKKHLLDFGKRNRLINFSEGRGHEIKIIHPSCEELYEAVVLNESEMFFPYARKVRVDEEGEEVYETIVPGDLETSRTMGELQRILKMLRYKANTSIEEQGINTLYLTFGMLKWQEPGPSSQPLQSPLVLVPVKLLIASLTAPYRLVLHDDEIVVNPTLSHKLSQDFGIVLPEFDASRDSLREYLERVSRKVSDNGWSVEDSTHLANLSFLKINMYKDLERNEERLSSHPIIAALAGEKEPVQVPEDFHDFDHDKEVQPIDAFQVVDADSSQQDAVLLSKKGVSFVLQGPPGTGKSQTITNIIAEAIAEGRKVLFVSEKMAALQVVYKRLASAGLADFCITLHSHKAKKKDILRELANSIKINRTRVREEALAQLDLLERKRNALNEYQAELHTPVSGLNLSIYAVNGKLACLEDVPNIIFPIENVEKITNQQLGEQIYLLGELSGTIGKRSEDYTENVWRNSNIRVISNALRHDIDSNIAQVLPLLQELAHLHTAVCSETDVRVESTLEGTGRLVRILALAAESPTLPAAWILEHDIDTLTKDVDAHKAQVGFIVSTEASLAAQYEPSIFAVEAEKCKEELCQLARLLRARVPQKDDKTSVDELENIDKELSSIWGELDALFEMAGPLARKLKVEVPDSIGSLEFFIQSMRALEEARSLQPAPRWFNAGDLTHIKSEMGSHKALHGKVQQTEKQVLSKFDKEILDLDFYPVLQRFRSEYGSSFRIFNGKYRKDMKHLNSFLSSGGKLPHAEAFGLLTSLKGLKDGRVTIKDNLQQYKDSYGVYYEGPDTNWERVEEALGKFERIVGTLHTITSQPKDLYDQGSLLYSEIVQFNVQSASFSLEEGLGRLCSLLKHRFGKTSPYAEIKEHVAETCTFAERFLDLYRDLVSQRKASCDFATLVADLDKLAALQDAKEALAEQDGSLRALYKDYYKGTETDWQKLSDALGYAVELKSLATEYGLSDAFVRNVCEKPGMPAYCRVQCLAISRCQEALKSPMEWFVSLFANGEDFYGYGLQALVERMSACKDKKYLLEEWVDYCANRKKCDEAGLGEYVKKVEELDLEAAHIVNAYLKRFYRLWLDAVLPGFPAVQNFRGRIQNQTVSEFCELDKAQFKIAQARVRERALSRIPDFNAINGARDEIAILKRELSKQRRVMPLRKLFMSIPNLVTSLRPCFMMSPLSVSVFLEAQSYGFDLVIFDEASQVHTEDAIGAIMRGKQVIIVGDTKQLPPTSFFSTTLDEDDAYDEYDMEGGKLEDDGSAGAYESILDEAVAILPERSLRWHYRSRHEHLIAFSNIQIYNNQLITFPSAVESAPDCGVEYIYVKEGVYDRSGKKNNVAEARKVADLVFEHFKKYPERSLGVVTFSEAQQNAVDAAIRQKRLQNPRFDMFFSEDKEEAFFVKNLENVQGDERDTIIFSIGYARDSKGNMYMNFGPLSHEGGYRRLNVAITRAKYNVKLVGSIVPSDIDLNKVSSLGVRMLRSYIEFAQQGIAALEKHSENVEVDSPFEEAVCGFLRSKGYDVETQVGCSEFRIDMAVRDSVRKDRFVLGIECDGRTYHNSRTARERDRLRQAVLEDMGWNLYRIWSTDWIKDPKIEEEKLVNAVEKALGHIVVEEEPPVLKSGGDAGTEALEIEEEIEPEEVSDTGYGFEVYQRTYPLRLVDEEGMARDIGDVVLDIVSLEQPIHFEEFCRRIAPAFGRQKVTSVVRDEARGVLLHRLDGQVLEDEAGFLRLKDFEEVKVRVPDPEDFYLRPVTAICDAELALAMKTVARHSFGMTPENLFIVTARELGFKRAGEAVLAVFRRVYERMLEDKEFSETDGKVQICGGLTLEKGSV